MDDGVGADRDMHLKRSWLRWIEKRLTPGEQQQAQAHLAACPDCGAELSEMQDVVEALEALPVALSALAWRPERLWPAIRVSLQSPPAPRPNGWISRVSLVSLVVVFCGVWWGSVFSTSPVATVEVSYVARPQTTPQLPMTPPREELAGTILPRLTGFSATPQPLPAPAQTPIFSTSIFTGTVTPGE
jgi:hypothetical protein